MSTQYSPWSGLKPLLGRTLEIALDRALTLDPQTRAALVPLEGRGIELTLEAPPLALVLTVREGRLVVGPARAEAPPDLRIGATLGAVLAQLSPFRDRDAAPVGRIHISGDAELAQRLQKLARGFDPDWEEPFARAFGDVLGHQIARALRAAFDWSRDSAEAMARNTAEFLTEESRDVVGLAELEVFYDEVDALRDRVERLAARIARLQGSSR